jgi:predicted phosphoribosyltransferase
VKRFADRRDAGRQLGALLAQRAWTQPVVLGLPRGGIPVAYEVAAALHAPMDVFVVRKLGVPGHEELAMGAIASGGVRVLVPDVVAECGASAEVIDAVTGRERRELERRERAYRGNRPLPPVGGRTVILVDDGVATGASMRAAVNAIRALGPEAVVIAAPVVSPDVRRELRRSADDCIAVLEPEPLYGVGAWYDDFAQTGDEEVCTLLDRARAVWSEPRAGNGTTTTS